MIVVIVSKCSSSDMHLTLQIRFKRLSVLLLITVHVQIYKMPCERHEMAPYDLSYMYMAVRAIGDYRLDKQQL